MELTTKAAPILGEFKCFRRLLWQLILTSARHWIIVRCRPTSLKNA